MSASALRLRDALAAGILLAASAGSPARAAPTFVSYGEVAGASAPPTYADCVADDGTPCYSPQLIRKAYGLDRLIAAGTDGTGQTIVIIDAYGSPTIASDLKTFDAGYGIPDPPLFKVLAPLGTVPWDPATYPDQPNWAEETSLDVEWAHAMAPGASIVLLTSPVDETEGVQGLPQFLALEQYALDHRLGHIISQSWSATENTLFPAVAGNAGPALVAAFEQFYARAVAAGITVLGSTGDDGSSNPEIDGSSFYPTPTVGFPASSPFVTAVGGTDLTLTASGQYVSETVWNDAQCCAGGGGVSALFREPAYQAVTLPRATQRTLGGMRGIPDISFNAGVYGESILVYLGLPGVTPGWYGFGGTSEGAPAWAGIMADLDQYVGRPIGFLNPSLYVLGGLGLFDLFGRDITTGNNTLTDVPGATAPGYAATAGWDAASGWGTPDLAKLPPSLFDEVATTAALVEQAGP